MRLFRPFSAPTRRWLVPLAVGALTLTVGACGTQVADGIDTSDSGGLAAGRGPAAALASVSPMADFIARGTSLGVDFQTDVLRRTDVCMEALGWQYDSSASMAGAVSEPTNPAQLLEYREHYGYGLLNPAIDAEVQANKAARSEAQAEADAYVSSLDATARARFQDDLGRSGLTEGGELSAKGSGCTGDAEQATFGHYPQNHPEIVKRVGELSQAVTQEPTYEVALQSWKACMSDAGYSVEYETEGRSLVSRLYGQPTHTDEDRATERAIGFADASCAADTLWPARAQLEARAVETIVKEFEVSETCGEHC